MARNQYQFGSSEYWKDQRRQRKLKQKNPKKYKTKNF